MNEQLAPDVTTGRGIREAERIKKVGAASPKKGIAC